LGHQFFGLPVTRQFAASFFAATQQEVTTLCYLWRIIRQDGMILGFTNFDQNLTIDGLTFEAAVGFNPSQIATDSSSSANNVELTSFFDSSAIAEADLVAGKYDFAEVQVYIVNYLDLPASLTESPPKFCYLLRGRLGEITNNGRGFTAECRAWSDQLNQEIGSLVSKTCRYDLGDSRCTVNLAAFSHDCTVVGVVDLQQLYLSTNAPTTDGYFNDGYLIFTSGDLTDVRRQIMYSNPTRLLFLWEPLPQSPEIGDQLTVVAGCDKTVDACEDKFNNLINFGGEHGGGNYMPGADEIISGVRA
jgi:uncharacterized phage protein (TIGR02218 family)